MLIVGQPSLEGVPDLIDPIRRVESPGPHVLDLRIEPAFQIGLEANYLLLNRIGCLPGAERPHPGILELGVSPADRLGLVLEDVLLDGMKPVLAVEGPGPHAKLLVIEPMLVFQFLPDQAIIERRQGFVAFPLYPGVGLHNEGRGIEPTIHKLLTMLGQEGVVLLIEPGTFRLPEVNEQIPGRRRVGCEVGK